MYVCMQRPQDGRHRTRAHNKEEYIYIYMYIYQKPNTQTDRTHHTSETRGVGQRWNSPSRAVYDRTHCTREVREGRGEGARRRRGRKKHKRQERLPWATRHAYDTTSI